ncbi:DUF4276 family protein [Azohydromonas caseinilytica]|uniref:DUF4276 family protein n=1 Tax=Azohydromonas caseinilytica TaxID=2728836 RepID=A0A848FGI7_9BURK|nr:DUF4276 family protein [Azohydromonas caseinilytica]NML18372.1 DUF4276 family protein [Azohydromonas caseinilytica]
MMGRIIFLVEEPSMKILLDELLPRLIPGWVVNQHFQCVKHEGKSDLDRSIPIKLRAWKEPGVRFVIVRDNDNQDCVALKQRLVTMCRDAGRSEAIVRLVCQELESWYLGDLGALSRAYDGAKCDTAAMRKRYTDPDSWQKPSVQVEQLIPEFSKQNGARRMARHLSMKNRSRSYLTFLSAVQAAAQGAAHG